MGKTEDLTSGFGGFTFANNSADKKTQRSAVTPSTNSGDKAHKAKNTATSAVQIAKGEKGNSTYANGLGGSSRTEVLVWAASDAVASKDKPWYCYTLKLSKSAGGIRLTGNKGYDQLDDTGGFSVEVQTVSTGGYSKDSGATLTFKTSAKPKFS